MNLVGFAVFGWAAWAAMGPSATSAAAHSFNIVRNGWCCFILLPLRLTEPQSVTKKRPCWGRFRDFYHRKTSLK
jgi:hypothetical protein